MTLGVLEQMRAVRLSRLIRCRVLSRLWQCPGCATLVRNSQAEPPVCVDCQRPAQKVGETIQFPLRKLRQ
jgi:hypothetical protein